jgi:signal transduction histidine kinase
MLPPNAPDQAMGLRDVTREDGSSTPYPWWEASLRVQNAVWISSIVLGVIIVGWVVVFFTLGPIPFLSPRAAGTGAYEMLIALGLLFGSLVLALASLDPVGPGMRWVSLGFLVLGLGSLVFGCLGPLFDQGPDSNLAVYSAGFARTVATILIIIGLVPPRPPLVGRRGVMVILSAFGLVSLFMIVIRDRLPALAASSTHIEIGESHVVTGLTWRHTLLGIGTIMLSCIAAWGAVRQVRRHAMSGWILIGFVLLAGSQLHALFWPSLYSNVMSTTTVLRIAFAAVVVGGAILELFALSRERLALLAREQERVRQLEELGAMKRDFTAMVAHELGTPLAAIGNLAELIRIGAVPQPEQHTFMERIGDETRRLQLLVRDFQDSDTIERDNFSVHLQRVPVRQLIEDASRYADVVRGKEQVISEIDADVDVMADPDRIGQVLRNFVNNAIRHTPSGTPIYICAAREDGGIRFSVRDEGPGIPLEEQPHILEKFVRGRETTAKGTGLGLYLSERIVQAHGSGITVESEPGHGSSFSFWLKECP